AIACGDPASPHTPTVAAVVVSPTSHSMAVGSQLSLNVTLTSVDGEVLQRPVTWISENEDVATVSAAGVVTGITGGTAVIRAMSQAKFGQATITVTTLPPVPVAEVRLSADTESGVACTVHT